MSGWYSLAVTQSAAANIRCVCGIHNKYILGIRPTYFNQKFHVLLILFYMQKLRGIYVYCKLNENEALRNGSWSLSCTPGLSSKSNSPGNRTTNGMMASFRLPCSRVQTARKWLGCCGPRSSSTRSRLPWPGTTGQLAPNMCSRYPHCSHLQRWTVLGRPQ